MLSSFMTFYKCYDNQDNMELSEGKTYNQWNEIENSEIDPHVVKNSFDKSNKIIQLVRESFQQIVLEHWTSEKNKSWPAVHTIQRI